jgi:hypothetical protein
LNEASRTKPVYPDVADMRHAVPETAAVLREYFDAKSRHSVDATMKFFAPDLLTYTDSTWGWPVDDYDALESLFGTYLPKWPASGLSYPVRVLGGPESALVEFIDTKELFGAELRVFGAVDFKDGKIVRWVDYWDSNTVDAALDSQMRTTAAKFPTVYKGDAVEHASGCISDVVRRLHNALSRNDATSVASLFSYESMLEDRTMRTQIVGRAAIDRYLARAAAQVPYGFGARVRHIVGGDRGGGYEWISSISQATHGLTALELNAAGQITRASTIYDGRLLPTSERVKLAVLALESGAVNC